MLEHYNAILGSIQDVCSTAHIAGGAVRDTLLDRPIKDIDLFLSDVAITDAASLLRHKFGYVQVGEWRSYEQFSDPAIIRLAKFERADETIPLCLIALQRPTSMDDNIARFDFGACMAAWDGHELVKSENFDTDVARQTFTLHRADNQPQFDYSMVRFRKITAERYAGWTLSVPVEFEEFARQHSFARAWYCDTEHGLEGPNTLKPKTR